MSENFKVIETQEELDKIIKSRLAQKDREIAESYKDYLSPEKAEALKADYEKKLEEANKNLKDAQDKLKTFDSTVSELTKRAETAEVSLMKNKVAIENKLPIELADRLIGANEDELKADAEKLSGILKPTSAPPIHISNPTSGASTGTGDINAGMAELVAQINAQMAN
ncbi:MAG: hypothetical protein IKE94_04815 [Aeriscardovia sp.]|nr:hypothetical protein [Aeriscardovia sp.]